MIHERYLQRAAAITAEFARTGLETTRSIHEAPDSSQALIDLFNHSDAVLAVYPDPAEYGGFNIVVAKEPVLKDQNIVSCYYCQDQSQAVALMCGYGDLKAEMVEGSKRLVMAGATDDDLKAALDGAIAVACETKQSYVRTLAAGLQFSDQTASASTHH